MALMYRIRIFGNYISFRMNQSQYSKLWRPLNPKCMLVIFEKSLHMFLRSWKCPRIWQKVAGQLLFEGQFRLNDFVFAFVLCICVMLYVCVFRKRKDQFIYCLLLVSIFIKERENKNLWIENEIILMPCNYYFVSL